MERGRGRGREREREIHVIIINLSSCVPIIMMLVHCVCDLLISSPVSKLEIATALSEQRLV